MDISKNEMHPRRMHFKFSNSIIPRTIKLCKQILTIIKKKKPPIEMKLYEGLFRGCRYNIYHSNKKQEFL